MRLISKTHDYYDTIQAYGVDLTSTFVRKERIYANESLEYEKIKKLVEPERHFGSRVQWFIGENRFEVDNYLIMFFCGQLIPIIKYYLRSKDSLTDKYLYYYDTVSIGEAMMKFGTKKQRAYWFQNKSPRRRYSISERYFQKNISEEFFDVNVRNSVLMDLHHEFESPYFMYDQTERRLIINPSLKNVSFYKIKDPFSAYQDIDMFVGGVLGGKSPKMIEISDKIRKEKHGFDKWSFRTPPKG